MPTIVGGAALLILIGALLYVGVAASGPPLDPGDKWDSFTSKDNSFTAYYPASWGEPSNAGSGGSFVQCIWKGSKLCHVSVHGSSGAGAKGDIAAAKERAMLGAMEGGSGQLPVSETADGALLDHFASETWLAKHSGYKATEAKFDYTFAGARSACSEYSFTRKVGLLPIKMKGIRWASQQGDYGYHVTAECPEKHWDKFKPVAMKIVGNVNLGGASG